MLLRTSGRERKRSLVDLKRFLVDTTGGELLLRPPPALGPHRGAADRVAGQRQNCIGQRAGVAHGHEEAAASAAHHVPAWTRPRRMPGRAAAG